MNLLATPKSLLAARRVGRFALSTAELVAMADALLLTIRIFWVRRADPKARMYLREAILRLKDVRFVIVQRDSCH